MTYSRLFGLSLLALISCKTSGSQANSEVMTSSNLCSDAVTAEKLPGDKIYQLTEQCVFNEKLHQVRIRILSETYKKVLEDGCAGLDSGYGHVLSLTIDGHAIENVGIKVRGNTSRCNNKRQFKFKFDETEMYSQYNGVPSTVLMNQNKNRKFFGLETISVRASANDPSMIREKIASDGVRAAGEESSGSLRGPMVYRLAPARLYVSFNRSANEGPEGKFNQLIDGYYYDYLGYYSLAENIDKVFVDTRFQKGNDKLTGYHLASADLAKASLDRETYDPKGWSPEFYAGAKVKTEEQQKALEEELFKLMDHVRSETNDVMLSDSVDIDSVVNYTAAAIFNGHWDSLISNANNDSIYFEGVTQKWQIFSWDLDNTLGANHALYKKLMSDDIFAPSREHPNRLFTTLFAKERPAFRQKLMKRLDFLAKGYYSEEQFNSKVNKLRDLVKASSDSWERPKDQDFEDIKAFVAQRRKLILKQISY